MFTFVPALRFHFLTKYFDRSFRIFFDEAALRNGMVAGIDNNPHKIVDFGCGTGSLCRLLEQQFPDAIITGVDADKHILSIAQKKSPDSKVQWAMGKDLRDIATCDVVTSSLVLHHLTPIGKENILKEIEEKLNPDGLFVLLDFDITTNIYANFAFFFVRCLDGFSRTKVHAQGKLLALVQGCTSLQLQQQKRFKTIAGTLKLYVFKKA